MYYQETPYDNQRLSKAQERSQGYERSLAAFQSEATASLQVFAAKHPEYFDKKSIQMMTDGLSTYIEQELLDDVIGQMCRDSDVPYAEERVCEASDVQIRVAMEESND